MNSPYTAQINFTINIHPVMEDGSLHPNKLTIDEMQSLGIDKNAVFVINGFNKEDCINKLVEVLSKLNYDE